MTNRERPCIRINAEPFFYCVDCGSMSVNGIVVECIEHCGKIALAGVGK